MFCNLAMFSCHLAIICRTDREFLFSIANNHKQLLTRIFRIHDISADPLLFKFQPLLWEAEAGNLNGTQQFLLT